jgi:hypothetical protein
MPTDIKDTIENRRLVSAIMQRVVDSEPDADPDHDDTIVINLDDLEMIVRTQICGEWSKEWEQYTDEEKREARGY